MNTSPIDQNLLKQQAGQYAAGLVQTGQTVGLGSGTTSAEFVKSLGKRWQNGEITDVLCIAASEIIDELAHYFQLPLGTLDDTKKIHLTVDGADEASLQTRAVIKGGRGAAYRERQLAARSDQLVIIVDQQKVSDQLGDNWAIPIDIDRGLVDPNSLNAASEVSRALQKIGAVDSLINIRLTDSGDPYITDDDRYIIDVNFGPITDPNQLACELDRLTEEGVIASHGLFVDLATDLVIAYPNQIKHYTWTKECWQLQEASS